MVFPFAANPHSLLNEVLSITAQELLGADGEPGAQVSSMKS